MYKVSIDSAGKISRDSDNEEIGIISGYRGCDFQKYPNTLKKTIIQLNSGENATIVSGGFIEGNFKETCHIKCVWTNCVSSGFGGCVRNPKLEDVGFYII